jgi:hypothetical protein
MTYIPHLHRQKFRFANEANSPRGKNGAPAGEYIVTVTWRRKPPSGDDEGESLLPGRYERPAPSGLRGKVEEQPNTWLPFRLTR